MNIVFHALVGLLLARLLGISHVPSILVGVLFSIFPDLDHIPHIRKALRTGRFGVESRSPLHELIGLGLVLSGSLVVGAFCPRLFLLASGCGASHFVIDFLTRPCRPLYPFSDREVDLNLYPKRLREMFIWDTGLTVALGIVYVIVTRVS